MICNKKVLAIIPARGGSKGIKNKNIIDLNGKPLIVYTIEEAKQSKYIDQVLVSTDSPKIQEISIQYGASVPFLRPEELASDTAKTLDTILYTIEELKKQKEVFDILILLQPTSPLRTVHEIDEAIELFMQYQMKSVVSISEVSDHPILIRTIEKDHLKPLLATNSTVRRQDFKAFYRVNGAIYINAIDTLNEKTSFNDNEIGYLMSKNHSIDIDCYQDLAVAQFLLKEEKGEIS